MKEDLKGDLKGDMKGYLEVDLEGDLRGDFKQDLDLEGDLLSSSGQLRSRSRSGLVQYRLKFNSYELDSEVGRLVIPILTMDT